MGNVHADFELPIKDPMLTLQAGIGGCFPRLPMFFGISLHAPQSQGYIRPQLASVNQLRVPGPNSSLGPGAPREGVVEFCNFGTAVDPHENHGNVIPISAISLLLTWAFAVYSLKTSPLVRGSNAEHLFREWQ